MPDSGSTQSVPANGVELRKPTQPCSIVIFGASGDLTARKLIPALYHLFKEKQMPPAFRVIGFARREKTDESWRAGIARRRSTSFRARNLWMTQVWREFAKNMFYCQGDITDARGLSETGETAGSLSAKRRCGKTCCFISPRRPASSAEVVEHLAPRRAAA